MHTVLFIHPPHFPFSIGTQVEAEHVLNRLWIGEAAKSDSGNYSCTIPGHQDEDFPRARVRVHVMDGNSIEFGSLAHLDNIALMTIRSF